MLKHLAAMGILYEIEADDYAPTPLSKALIDSRYQDAFPTVFVKLAVDAQRMFGER